MHLVTLSLAVAYGALILLSAPCAVPASAVQPGSHHHVPAHHGGQSHGEAAHSMLCAWACQVGSTAAVLATESGGCLALSSFMHVRVCTVPDSIAWLTLPHLRGPPSSPILG